MYTFLIGMKGGATTISIDTMTLVCFINDVHKRAQERDNLLNIELLLIHTFTPTKVSIFLGKRGLTIYLPGIPNMDKRHQTKKGLYV